MAKEREIKRRQNSTGLSEKRMFKRLLEPIRTPKKSTPPVGADALNQLYQEQVSQNHIRNDDAQVNALQHLQTLMNELLQHVGYEQQSVIQRLRLKTPDKCRNVYIYGKVGRGKSMLMDLFFDACPIKKKRRVHFHVFLLEVHQFRHQWRQKETTGDMIQALAKHIRDSASVLCFDEFQVSDIADAMILGRLFSQLFEMGLVVVATSNRHPDNLYQGGLQRELFLPFIQMLKETSNIVELAAKEDYRLSQLQALEKTYYSPLNPHAEESLQQCYNQLTNCAPRTPGVLNVFGREVVLTAVHGDVAFTTFAELCGQPLGAADYLEIASDYTTLLIAGIPRLTPEKRNEAKRFATLVDTLYEHKVKLICSAEVPPHELYVQGDGLFEFKRTVSRLVEMQSENYIDSEHIVDLRM